MQYNPVKLFVSSSACLRHLYESYSAMEGEEVTMLRRGVRATDVTPDYHWPRQHPEVDGYAADIQHHDDLYNLTSPASIHPLSVFISTIRPFRASIPPLCRNLPTTARLAQGFSKILLVRSPPAYLYRWIDTAAPKYTGSTATGKRKRICRTQR
jgi:hypothetical protein